MKKFKLLSKTRSAGKVNEDLIHSSRDFVAIFDGATSISGRKNVLNDIEHTDASWFVQFFASQLESSPSIQNDIKPCLSRICMRADVSGSGVWNDWDSGDMPSASFSAVLLGKEKHTIVNLGDCKIFYLLRGSDEFLSFGDCAVEHLDKELLNEYKHLRGVANFSHLQAWTRLVPRIRTNRALKNTKEGYWILDPSGVGVPYTQMFEVLVSDCLAIVMCTDGLFRLVDTYGILSISDFLNFCSTADGIEHLFEILEQIELQDADAQKYPRLKIRDDATIVSMFWR